ncbi:MAG: thiamine phosphate synthase [Acidobacteria bacterium]|nr:thiamine phosphate synthase [Acidobacteriota bacterium]
MRPVICLVTPPLVRLKPDTTYVASGFSRTIDALIDRIGAAARAGVHLVQIRQPGLDGRSLLALAGGAVAAVRGTGTRVVVNDRLDVALAAGAHGVHLRGDSVPAARARSASPRGFLIGRSVHRLEEARAAAGEGAVDYLIYGTVFDTDSKPAATAAGTDALAEVCAAVPVPVLAIGGMAVDRLGAVAAAGADGFAAIGLFARATPDGVRAIVEQAARAFDTPRTLP